MYTHLRTHSLTDLLQPAGNGVAMVFVPALHAGENRVLLWGRHNSSSPVVALSGHTEPVLELAWRRFREGKEGPDGLCDFSIYNLLDGDKLALQFANRFRLLLVIISLHVSARVCAVYMYVHMRVQCMCTCVYSMRACVYAV